MVSHNRKEDRNLDIVCLRLEKKTLEEIGAIHGITRERVRQILKFYDIPCISVSDLKRDEVIQYLLDDHEYPVSNEDLIEKFGVNDYIISTARKLSGIPQNGTPKQRLWSQVKKYPNKCWEWQGACNKKLGYGILVITDMGEQYAHRVSWKIANGEIPDGMHVLHKCDNKRCVKPSHLYLGTQADNVRDRGNRHLYYRRPSRARKRAIKKAVENGMTRKKIAKFYGMAPISVSKIANGT